jgi:hypothetical protein
LRNQHQQDRISRGPIHSLNLHCSKNMSLFLSKKKFSTCKPVLIFMPF